MFEDLKSHELGKFNLIIGKNGSGKHDLLYSLFDNLSKSTRNCYCISDNNTKQIKSNNGDVSYLGERIDELLNDFIEYNSEIDFWVKKKDNKKIARINDGVLKMIRLSKLAHNGYLDKGSIIFISDIEYGLAPKLLTDFIEACELFSRMKFVITTNSYLVLQFVELLAKKYDSDNILLDLDTGNKTNLKLDMPSNLITDEGIRIYKEYVNLALNY